MGALELYECLLMMETELSLFIYFWDNDILFL